MLYRLTYELYSNVPKYWSEYTYFIISEVFFG